MDEKKVFPYKDGVQKRVAYANPVTHEYLVPFNYENIKVVRAYNQCEKHGMEINTINSYWPDPAHRPNDYIEVFEDRPIIRVEVIGSACTPPGYITLEFDPCDGFYRADETPGIVATRMRVDNLWGMHLRVDQWVTRKTPDVKRYNSDAPYEQVKDWRDHYTKSDFREFPLTGFSCGVFSIPRSKSVKISGGGVTPGWTNDNFPDDSHYSFRIIRTTVCDVAE